MLTTLMHDWAITLTNELLEKAARFTDGQQHEGTSIKVPEKKSTQALLRQKIRAYRIVVAGCFFYLHFSYPAIF